MAFNKEEFLKEIVDKRYGSMQLDKDVKDEILADARQRFNNIRTRCTSDEEAAQELLIRW